MTDCEAYGHPVVDGHTCPCGIRTELQYDADVWEAWNIDAREWGDAHGAWTR